MCVETMTPNPSIWRDIVATYMALPFFMKLIWLCAPPMLLLLLGSQIMAHYGVRSDAICLPVGSNAMRSYFD